MLPSYPCFRFTIFSQIYPNSHCISFVTLCRIKKTFKGVADLSRWNQLATISMQQKKAQIISAQQKKSQTSAQPAFLKHFCLSDHLENVQKACFYYHVDSGLCIMRCFNFVVGNFVKLSQSTLPVVAAKRCKLNVKLTIDSDENVYWQPGYNNCDLLSLF